MLMVGTVEAQSKKTWDKISWVTVITQVSIDVIEASTGPNKKKELLKEGIKLGATGLSTQIVKRLVHKERPDHSDDMSFWSGHSAYASDAMSWSYKPKWQVSIGVPLTAATMYGRQRAKKHFWIDTIVGASIGFGIDRLTEKVVK